MPRNASGVFSFTSGSFSPAVSGTVIASAAWNTLREEIVTDLNAARPVTAGGTGATNASAARTNLGLGDLAVLDTVSASEIDADAVTTAKILDANVTAAKLASDAVETAKILDANVTTAKIADANVTTAKIADDAITADKIADDAVGADQLSGWASSIGANGYVTLPGGLTIQWGSVSSITSNSGSDVTFPVAFSTACYAVTISAKDSSVDDEPDGSMHARNISTTGFRACNSDVTGNDDPIDVSWIAIGS